MIVPVNFASVLTAITRSGEHRALPRLTTPSGISIAGGLELVRLLTGTAAGLTARPDNGSGYP